MHSAQVHKWTHREGELFFDRSFFLARTLPHFVNDFFLNVTIQRDEGIEALRNISKLFHQYSFIDIKIIRNMTVT